MRVAIDEARTKINEILSASDTVSIHNTYSTCPAGALIFGTWVIGMSLKQTMKMR